MKHPDIQHTVGSPAGLAADRRIELPGARLFGDNPKSLDRARTLRERGIDPLHRLLAARERALRRRA